MLEYSLDIAGVIALIITLSQLFFSWRNSHVSLSLDIRDTQFYTVPDRKNLLFLIFIENHSSLPLNINCIDLIFEDEKYQFSLTHKQVFVRNHPSYPETDVPSSERVFSADFPISLDAYGATMKYIYLKLPLDSEVSCQGKVTLALYTQRKKKPLIVKTTAPIPLENPISR